MVLSQDKDGKDNTVKTAPAFCRLHWREDAKLKTLVENHLLFYPGET